MQNEQNILELIKQDEKNHILAMKLIDQGDIDQILLVFEYFTQNHIWNKVQQTFYRKTQEYFLDQILSGYGKYIVAYLNMLKLHGKYINPEEDKLIQNIIDDDKEVIFLPDLFKIFTIMLQSSSTLSNLKKLIYGYIDLRYYLLLYLKQNVNIASKFANFIEITVYLTQLINKTQQSSKEQLQYFNNLQDLQVKPSDVQQITDRYLSDFCVKDNDSSPQEQHEQQQNTQAQRKNVRQLIEQARQETLTNKRQSLILIYKLTFSSKNGYLTELQKIYLELLKQFAQASTSDMNNKKNRQLLYQYYQLLYYADDIVDYLPVETISFIEQLLVCAKNITDIQMEILCIYLLLNTYNKYQYVFVDYYKILYDIITPEAFQANCQSQLLFLLESALLDTKIELAVVVLLMKKLAQTAAISSDEIQYLLVNLLLFVIYKEQKLKFLLQPQSDSEYIFVHNMAELPYEEAYKTFKDIENSGCMDHVCLQELAILLRSSNKNVQQLLYQVYNGQFQNNVAAYQQLRRNGVALNQYIYREFAVPCMHQSDISQYYFNSSNPPTVKFKHMLQQGDENEGCTPHLDKLTKELHHYTVNQLIEKNAIETAGGDVMLKNLQLGIQIKLLQNIDQQLFSDYDYNTADVWERVAPRKDKESSEDSEQVNKDEKSLPFEFTDDKPRMSKKYDEDSDDFEGFEEEYEEFEEFEEYEEADK